MHAMLLAMFGVIGTPAGATPGSDEIVVTANPAITEIANCVAPGPIWTPLIPSTMPAETVRSFGEQVPMNRPGQPRELAPIYVMLASDEASYVSGATVAVTGGKPII